MWYTDRPQGKSPDILSTSSNNFNVESPAGVLETTYGIVLGPFFHQLVQLFFRNIHPYYPVIDEFDFDACFIEPIEDENVRHGRACVLGVMLLEASMARFHDPITLMPY